MNPALVRWLAVRLLAEAALPSTVMPVAVGSTGRVEGGAVAWRTTVVVEEAAVPPVGAATLTLVDPLPPGADLAPVDWVRPVRDGSDRVVAISLDRLAWDNPRDGTLRV